MKTSIIQLEPHDDVISIRDKITWCKTSRILLIWPVKSPELHKMDCVLIQRASKQMGTQLAFVTEDEKINFIAQELGIPVFGSMSQAHKQFWRRPKTKKKSFARNSPLELPNRYNNPPPPNWVDRRPVRVGLFCSGIFAILALMGFLLPEAKIILYPIREIQTVTLDVHPNQNITSINVSGGVPAQIRSIVVEGEDSLPSSGTMKIPVRPAIGIVEFTNLTGEVFQVPAGQIISTTRDPSLRFIVMQSFEMAGKVNQKREARIQAVMPGEKGNVRAGEIQAVEGSLGFKVAVTNPSPTSGGEDQISPAPSIEDYQVLRERLILQLKQTAIKELTTAIGKDYLLEATMRLNKVVNEVVDPPDNISGEILRLTLRAEFAVWTVKAEDMEILAQRSMDAGLPDTQIEIPGTLVIKPSENIHIDGDYIDWQVSISRQVERIIDRERILALVIGKTIDEAKANLESNEKFEQSPRVHLSPVWWPRMPLLGFRISTETP